MRRHLYHRYPIFALLLFVILTAPARACIQDSDTLAQEARGMRDIVQIITGRFERNPPLYYQMRLQRVAAESGKPPCLR